jgi:hypothetical protein
MRVAALAVTVLVLLPLGAGVAADPPAFDGSREALTIPDAVWARVLADAGREGRALGYTADEMRAFGKDAHLLRNVQALFADARKIPRETGRITTQLLENAAKLPEVIARGYALTDVSAGRMYAVPKEPAWWLKDELGDAKDADAILKEVATKIDGDLDAVAPAVRAFAAEVWVGAATAVRRLPDAWPACGDPLQHCLMAPYEDELDGQTATFLDAGLEALATFDRAALAYASMILATHVDAALGTLRAALAEGRVTPHAPTVRITTRLGSLLLRGADPDEAPTPFPLLVVDVAGDDVCPTAAHTHKQLGTLAVHVDLAGNDTYGSGSTDATVACGLCGVALLIDLAGDDTYASRESGLGCGVFGTGVLLDVAGDDSYRSTAAWGQGSAHAGVGALIDLAGNDDYECAQQSQGLGGPLGAGLLIDVAGNDSYVARDDGNVSALYLGQSVAMSQGCGYGRRADIGDGRSVAGGVGVLVDGAGDDRYHAQVWAQGCGYWWGLGILEDRGGDDAYQNGKYSAGAAAHFAIGVCIDLSGDDLHNAYNTTAKNQFQGHARDGSIGVFVDGDGDDAYDVCHNCAGSGDLNSIGLFWDRRGNDRYTFHPTDLTEAPNGWNDTGAFGTSTRYKPFQSFRDDLPTWGVFLDTGGDDTYVNERPPKGFEATPAADGATWKPHRGPLFFGLGYDLE